MFQCSTGGSKFTKTVAVAKGVVGVQKQSLLQWLLVAEWPRQKPRGIVD